jgi:hypothetical protein
MTNRIADLTQRKAVTFLRILYPIWFVLGLFSIMYVPTTLIVPGDATTTANNIMANEMLFRSGIVGSLLVQIIQILVVLLLYKLLKPVNKNYAVLMVVFALVGIPISMLNTLNRVAALVLLNGADYLKVFGADHLHTLVMLFLNLNEQGVLIATVFWGLWLLPLGYLVYKSGYFPRILGVLLILGGFGYLLDFFTHFLLPNRADYEAIFFPAIILLTLGEILFMGWIVLKGANLPEMKSSN